MIKKSLSIIFVIFATFTSVKAQVNKGTFLQEIKTSIRLPKDAGINVIRLFQIKGNIVAVTENGVYRKTKDGWTGESNGSAWKTACVDKNNKVWLASDNFIQNEDNTVKINLPDTAWSDTIICLFWENKIL